MKHEQTFSIGDRFDRPADLVALVQMHARIQPDNLAYVFLEDGEREGARLTFGDLDRRARAIASHLQRHTAPLERALLLFPPGLGYIEAFFGCLYAGVIAVPAYPPSGRHLARLRSILTDAEPSVILTTQALCARLSQDSAIGLERTWIATDGLDSSCAGDWRAVQIEPDQIAFLQYTSGSTGDPRGVMVSHGNLIANEALIKESFHHDESSTLVGWLPLYHDMGLIGNILQPLYAGATAYLMSPMAFLEKPVRWLAAIAKFRAHTSGGPNFGYELCIRKISRDEKEGLDLSSWRIAFSGAEPVRAATLDRFVAAFAQCGFRKQSFYPCYGLAEATLVVSAPSTVRETPIRALERKALEAGRARVSEGDGMEIVGCGHAWPAHTIRIVAPMTRTECGVGEIGEIWAAGPSVARGYWRREAETDECFRARLASDDTTPFLRTGDLGFVEGDELYVTGRLKDLIIINGRNYYPHDIEGAIDELVEGLRPGSVTAVQLMDGETESYIVFAEPRRADPTMLRSGGGQALIRSIRAALAGAIEIAPRDIVLLKPGSTPKTSSGKTRRAECRRAYLVGEFDVLARASDAEEDHVQSVQTPKGAADPLLKLALAQLTPEQRAPLLSRLLVTETARLLRITESEIDADAPISQSGLDSLKIVELRHRIEQEVGVAPPLAVLLSDASFSNAAQAISRLKPESAPALESDRRLSFSQQAMWTVQRLDADSVIYNLHLALQIDSIDAMQFGKSLDDTVAGNEQLRTLYRETGEGAEAIEKSPEAHPSPLQIVDARDWDDVELQADFARRAAEPFDLETQSPLRVTLYQRHDGNALLFVAHHIAVDFWSLLLFITELDSRYRGTWRVGQAVPARYGAFAARQRRYLESPRSENDWDYWRERLGDELPMLQLPRDFPRRFTPSYAGASRVIRLDKRLSGALHSLAQKEGVSLFSLLLTAYFILLQRYSGQSDIIVGAPTSGRLDAEFAHTIGNFVNPVAIRAVLDPRESGRAALRRIHERVREALAHQEFPFPLLVERLRPTRDRDSWPIYQTTFALQKVQSEISENLAILALGENAERLDLLGSKVRAIGLRDRVENFDLKLVAAVAAEGLVASFQYRTHCFADATIEQMAHHYRRLLEALVANPGNRIDSLPLMDACERAATIDKWNQTATNSAFDVTVAQQFEAHARRAPDAVALIFRDQRLSYGELNRRANRLAHHLRAIGVGAETIVAVCLDRDPDLFVALLGIMKAGGAFLPLDPELPEERLRLMIEDASPALIVTQTPLLPRLPSGAQILKLDAEADSLGRQRDCDLKVVGTSRNLAYALFTSGSTGRPKAVAIEHRAVANCVADFVQRLAMTPTDRWLAVTTISFDIAMLEIFAPLASGAAIILSDPAQRLDPVDLATDIAAHGVTHMQATPSLWAALLDSNWAGSGRLTALVGGEKVSQALARKLAPACRLALNVYGPTEATIWSSVGEMRARGGDLGRPIANTQIHVMSSAFEIAPIGVVGEAVIGGLGLARGYLGRAYLTAERFIPDISGPPGARLYRTGDLVRRRLDGGLDYLGRMDEQVKIRGFRIEVGEIEATLLQNDRVAAAVVVAKRDRGEHMRLVAYVAPAYGCALDGRELRDALAQRLPDYMTPSAIVILDALPLNANHKVDRRALPDPEAGELIGNACCPPATRLEATLVDVWAEILGIDRLGVMDNFFDLGGDSIRAIQVASRIRRLGYELTPREIFHHPTVRRLAGLLQDRRGAHPECVSPEIAAETIAPFALADLDAQALQDIRSEHPDAEDIYRLTPLQEGMLLHSLAQQGCGVYHLQERYNFRGALDVEAFFDAWRSVVARHATLRTSFDLDGDGRPYQLVHSGVELPCNYSDLSLMGPERQMQEIEALLDASRAGGFDLSRAPLLRIHLVKLSSDLHLCVRDFHHIILDDWCTSPLMLDVRNHYAAAMKGESINVEAAPQFRDYIGWLRRQDLAAAQSYWTRYLAGFSDPTPLVVAKAGEAGSAAMVDDVFAEVSSKEFNLLKAIAREHRLTVNTFVQAAVGLLLCRYAGVQEAVFGITVAGRPAELPKCDEALGLFINGLPLRVRVAPDRSVLDWLKALLADNVEMRQHEFVSQSMIQQWSEIPRSDALLFQHLLTFENAPIDRSLVDDRSVFDITLAGLRVHTNYPITFVAIPGETLALRITYDRDRFTAADMRRMIRHWRLLIVELARNAGGVIADLAPLDDEERRQTIVDWNRTERDYGAPLDLVARFEGQAQSNGAAIAAGCGAETLTFAALNERANRLSHALIERGFGENDIIAIFDERGLDFLTSMLAIFKCGAGYLPIDPAYPDGRIGSVLKEAHVAAVLAGPQHLSRATQLTPRDDPSSILDRAAIEAASTKTENPQRRHTPRSVAFVIYTSGSTGKPKGAIVEHRGMFNNLITKVPPLGLTSSDVIAQTASQCFDISVWQFLLGLAIGARVEILPDEISRDPEKLIEAIPRCGITILESVPSMIRALLDAAEDKSLDSLRWLIPCGEAFTPELCRRVMAEHPSLRLLNAYGPAECSDDVTYYPIEQAPTGNELSTPIGRPVDNCQIYVLNRWLDPAPIGAPGEICVAGVQVGRGYLWRPDLTADAFRPNPFGAPGSVLYRTGDLGRWQTDGVLDFLGRIDHQVKIRGHRIEPGEIEACLVTHPAIEEACVLPRAISKGVYQLVAYLVGPDQEPSGLRAYLAQTLPDFMLPSFFVFLERMPLSPNGKIDRRRLPAPDVDFHRIGCRTAPRTPTEKLLGEIWSELLGVEEIGVEDNFFELGGHSLLAIQLRSRIQTAFDVEVPLKNLFNTTTVESLARQIEELVFAEINAMSEAYAESLNAQYAD